MATEDKTVAQVTPAKADVPATPDESKNASMRVKPQWPIKSFTVEDIPVITADGTMLTKTQLNKAEAVAEASGVTLISEEVK